MQKPFLRENLQFGHEDRRLLRVVFCLPERHVGQLRVRKPQQLAGVKVAFEIPLPDPLGDVVDPPVRIPACRPFCGWGCLSRWRSGEKRRVKERGASEGGKAESARKAMSHGKISQEQELHGER
jgi:hypothetical protein